MPPPPPAATVTAATTTPPSPVLPHPLHTLSARIQALAPHKLTSSSRRASVAAILRVRPKGAQSRDGSGEAVRTLDDFFKLQWVQQGDVEILYIRRAVNERDKWSGHMAFPGGKAESNETDQQAVEREVLEELNLDLRSDGFVCIGEIGDREVTPMGGRRPVMILSCFVYLQLLPYTPPLTPQPSEIASVHWIPIHFFLSLARDPAQWVGIRFSMARILIWGRHAQHMALGLTAHLKRGVEKVLGWWLGSYTPFGVLLPHENSDTHHRVALTKTGKKTAKEATGQSSEGHLLLWGLTLSMTSEIVDLYYPLDPPLKDLGRPRFSQWDIRVWVRVWEGVGRVQAKLESGGRRSRGRRVNGEGFTTNTVVKCAIGSTVLGRGITMWIVWRGLLGVREWWRVWV